MLAPRRGSLAGDTLICVHQDVERLLVQATIYKILYVADDGKKVTDTISPTTFFILRKSLQETMLMSIARMLLDPAMDNRGNENLGLETIVISLPDSDADMRDRFLEMRAKHKHLQKLRHKFYSHRDESTVYAVARLEETPVRKIVDKDVLAAIDDIEEFWREIFARMNVPADLSQDVDTDEMIAILSQSLDS